MERLTKLMQYEVRYVRNIINRPLTEDFETLYQPLGRWSDLDPAYDSGRINSGRITHAEIRIANLNRGRLACLTL